MQELQRRKDPLPTFADERRELETILTSPGFPPTSTRGRLLRYVCEKHFEGHSEGIKEYNLAVEVFGRPPDFDKKRFSVVRVEAYRLRKKLQEYYAGEGKDHDLHIEMSPGQYTPRFVPRGAMRKADSQPEPEPPVALPLATARESHVRTLLVWCGLLFITGVAVTAVALAINGSATRPARAFASAPATRMAAAPPGDGIRILAGLRSEQYVDRLGRAWTADRFFTGGSTSEVAFRTIYRSGDPLLYLKAREGDFRYDIPLKAGSYELRLHFAETLYGDNELLSNGGEASRIFDVELNGEPLLEHFDVISDAGGPNTADVKVFRDVSPAQDGYLRLAFRGPAVLNGIEILPGTPRRLRPIRIAAGRRTAYTDTLGQVWDADQYWQGGRMVFRDTRPKAEPDPGVYLGERFGNFSYAIPVDRRGVYTANLKFVEQFWGPGGLAPFGVGPGGVGSRLFDIHCNGRVLLHAFDIYEVAGGRANAITKTFRDLRPNAQGKLVFTFVPIASYAAVNAIEIIDES